MLDIDYKLLDHPFYQAWENGEITTEQLSKYAESYQKLMNRIPDYWQKVLDGVAIKEDSELIDEEAEHAKLWAEWRNELPDPEEAPELEELFSALEGLNPLQLAGALHAYEVQQPDVAETKKDGLVEFYGFDEDSLDFFDEHIENEDEHIAFGRKIRETSKTPEQFDEGFKEGAKALYHSLDAFCNV